MGDLRYIAEASVGALFGLGDDIGRGAADVAPRARLDRLPSERCDLPPLGRPAFDSAVLARRVACGCLIGQLTVEQARTLGFPKGRLRMSPSCLAETGVIATRSGRLDGGA
ncbi:MAG: hypothetical protein ACLQHS_16120 [Candidatus Limnocylindrales bacterium]